MGLKSKLSAQIEVKAKNDVFHDAFRHKPHHISTMTPVHVQGCDCLEGDFGTVGSKICWKYTHGKPYFVKIIKNLLTSLRCFVDILNVYLMYYT